MKFKSMKKIILLLSLLTGIAYTAYSATAVEATISLNSPTTFPVDI